MSDVTQRPPRRAISNSIEARRRAMIIIKPFVPLFEDWNQRAAKASAMALSHASSAGERAQQVHVLHELFEEVRLAYDEFETAVAGEPPHGRIDDLRAAFSRLLKVLGQWQ